MHNIIKSMTIPDLNLKPPIDTAVKLTADMTQTLALLTAYADNKRVTLQASGTGVLSVASAKIKDLYHYTGVGANDTQIGENIPCTECMVMGHPDNTGTVWVRPYKTATVDNAWPLLKSETVDFTLDNLKQLNMLIVVDGEKVIVAYTR